MGIIQEVDDYKIKYLENLKPSALNLIIGLVLIILLVCSAISIVEKTFLLTVGIKQGLLIIPVILFCYFWYIRRKIPKFSTEDNVILFAFNKLEPKTKAELDILYKKVLSNIKEENLKYKIKVRILPEHIQISDFENAKDMREKSNAKVVIWGEAESGTIHSQKKGLILNKIRFIYETRLKKEDQEGFNQNISRIISRKVWAIDENEQIIERNYLSRNVKEISLYLIGWTLILSNSEDDRNDGVNILQKLFNCYKEKTDLNDDEKLMILNLKARIAYFYGDKVRDMNFRFTDKYNVAKIKKGRDLLNEIIDSGIDSLYYSLFECILDFLENNPQEKIIKKLKKEVEDINGKDAPVYYSLAFVEYYGGNIRNGFEYLKKAIKLKPPIDQLSSIVGWYQEALSEDSRKIYLNFPIGQIYYNLLEPADPQREIAKESLEKFTREYINDKEMVALIDEASRMLNNISK